MRTWAPARPELPVERRAYGHVVHSDLFFRAAAELNPPPLPLRFGVELGPYQRIPASEGQMHSSAALLGASITQLFALYVWQRQM